MRLIGNKSKLLGAIEDLLRDRGHARGTLVDIFSGTANVGRHFKRLGFRVIANDHLSSAYTQAVAAVEVSRWPEFAGLRRLHRETIASREFRDTLVRRDELDFEPPRSGRGKGGADADPSLPLRQAVHLLDRFVPPREGLIYRNYCPGGPAGRRYFRDEHGRKIDAVLEFLRQAWQAGTVTGGELHLLLASLIDAADRVANISGTYGAYLKTWQRNTQGPMQLEPPEVVLSPFKNEAHQADANALVRRLEGDVLYIDPPYNHRQYAANYHLLEVLAEHHRIADLAAYEAALYGKTGLRPYGDLHSLYCVRPGARGGAAGNALTAFSDLVLSSRARCVVVSYNEEGLLSRDEIGVVLARFSQVKRFDFDRGLREISVRRFRSDADRPPVDGRGGRSYRVLDGKGRDRVGELLFFAERVRSAGGARGRAASRAGLS